MLASVALSRRRCDGVPLRSNSLSEKPHFFIIIHPALFKQGKPGIPTRFLREHGKHLSSVIFLDAPNGLQWRVELMKRDGEALLQEGWQQFCDFYAIRYGHFLLFRYEGNSHFHVFIFDTTACEIEYPSPSTNPAPREQNHESDVSVEILDDFPARQTSGEEDVIDISSSEEELSAGTETVCLPKTTENYKREFLAQSSHDSLPSRNARMKTRERNRKSPPPKSSAACKIQSKGIQRAGVKVEKSQTKSDLVSSTSKLRHEGNSNAKESRRGNTASTPPATACKNPPARLRAESFKSKNPFFVITMQPHYARGGNLNVPRRFVERHFTPENVETTLFVSDGSRRRSWSVRYGLTSTKARFYTTGWRKFALDNRLQAGDVCVFELIKPSANFLKVVIFRK